jgi:hypothetical protein
MPTMEIIDHVLKIELSGAEKFAALSGSLSFPMNHVKSVAVDDAVVDHLGLRAPGVHVPGVFAAGTYYHDGDRQFVFWHEGEIAVAIDLIDEKYDKVIVGVAGTRAEADALVASLSQP